MQPIRFIKFRLATHQVLSSLARYGALHGVPSITLYAGVRQARCEAWALYVAEGGHPSDALFFALSQWSREFGDPWVSRAISSCAGDWWLRGELDDDVYHECTAQ